MLIAVLGLIAWLFVTNPLLVNPSMVVSRLEADTLETPTLMLMAAMTPWLFLMCLILLAVVILFAFTAVANERRLIQIIDDLAADRGN